MYTVLWGGVKCGSTSAPPHNETMFHINAYQSVLPLSLSCGKSEKMAATEEAPPIVNCKKLDIKKAEEYS